MHISRRAKETAPFYVMEVADQATALEEQGIDIIHLNVGEPDFGAAPAVLEALPRIAHSSLAYTGALGIPELRQAIAGFYRTRHGVGIAPERIVVTSGATGALLLLAAALVDPGDEVLLADPTYPCNVQILAGFGADVRLVRADAAHLYQLDSALVRDNWGARTKGAVVASPANPTGSCIPFDELAPLTRTVAERDGWLLFDEIYLDLTEGDAPGGSRPSVLSVDPQALVVNSFSKYFGMTGWRLGWAVVPDDLVDPIERLSQNFVICPSVVAQKAALECFEPETLAIFDARRDEFRKRREIVLAGLEEMGLPVPVKPDGAFYAYFDVSGTGLGAAEFCSRALHEAHVALTPGKDFGPATADTHVRFSYSVGQDQLREALVRLGGFVKSLCPGC
ncbi:aminotransferase class I/II-fold pyridoxal phosphate-dependent enzyme [Propionibacterium sp.]|uniref:aminotransferase class I/II-fold pyridoxal phosphate-dependent enzyme n=1 Tax=Propionibacterium sp. TaxID=1977903 RepID=UPI0039E86630